MELLLLNQWPFTPVHLSADTACFHFCFFERLFSLLRLQAKQQESQSVKAKVEKESKSVATKV